MMFGYASLGVGLARNILFVPIYLRNIPLAEYGAWLATGGALALLLISDFGLSGVVTQKASATYGAGDLRALGSLIGSALLIGFLLALALTALCMVFLPFLPSLQTLNESEARTVVECFAIVVVANALGLFGATAISVVRSLQRPVMAGLIAIVSDVANIGVTLVGLFKGYGLYALAAGILVRSTIIAITAPLALLLVCSRAIGVRIRVQWESVWVLFGESARFFLSAVAMKIQAQANILFVGMTLGPTSAAIYGLTVRAHETVLMLIGQINAALVPSITHLFGSGNLIRFGAVVRRVLLLLSATAAFGLSLTIILNPAFLKLWVGRYTVVSQDVSIIMGIALFVSSVGYVAYDALVAQGKFQLVSYTFLLTSTLQVSLLLVLLHLGLWIAPTVTLLTACIWGLLFWKSVASSLVMRLEARALISELARVVGMSAVTVTGFLLFYPAVNSWPALGREAAFGAAVLAGGYLILSAQIRSIAREEWGTTMRSLGLT
jgi:O-antigen/teichoic acid export membrane protein